MKNEVYQIFCFSNKMKSMKYSLLFSFCWPTSIQQRLQIATIMQDFMIPMTCQRRRANNQRRAWRPLWIFCFCIFLSSLIMISRKNTNRLQCFTKTHIYNELCVNKPNIKSNAFGLTVTKNTMQVEFVEESQPVNTFLLIFS